MLLSTKNLTNNKLNILYIKVLKVRKVKEVIVILELSNIRVYLRFYISLLKKVLSNTLKVKS